MFKNLSFKRKITLLVGVAIAGLCVLTLFSVAQIRSHIVDGRKAQLVALVQSAHSVVSAYQAKAAAGEMTVAEAQKAAQDALRLARYGSSKTDYFYLWTLDGVGVMHPFKPEWAGQPMIGKVKDADGTDVLAAMLSGAKASTDGNAFVPTNFPRPGQTEPQPKLQYVSTVAGWNWIVGSGMYMDDVDAQVRQALVNNLALVLLLLAGIGSIGFVVARSVLRQIGGEPTQAMQAMADVAGGDLSVQLNGATPGSLLAGLSDMIASLRSTVSEVRRSTDSIATASGEIAAGNQDLSARTEQTASNLQQSAAAMDELTSTVQQTESSARTANELASSASQAAAQGG
ncbi:MAG TPA: cache domain-containing protein, partial [Albitalea sp.]|nr:cache domain-containing protein [Albitalea sp.]